MFNLHRWRQNIDPFKEYIKWIIIWVCLLGLPVELWSKFILRKLLKQIGKVIKLILIQKKFQREGLLEYVLRLTCPSHFKWNYNIKEVMLLSPLLLIM